MIDADGNVVYEMEGNVSIHLLTDLMIEDWYKVDTVPDLQITLSVEDYRGEVD